MLLMSIKKPQLRYLRKILIMVRHAGVVEENPKRLAQRCVLVSDRTIVHEFLYVAWHDLKDMCPDDHMRFFADRIMLAGDESRRYARQGGA